MLPSVCLLNVATIVQECDASKARFRFTAWLRKLLFYLLLVTSLVKANLH
jgi:hypothetical protein